MSSEQITRITRRSFCKQTVATTLLAATAQVVAGEKKETEETIDCHTHFYDPTRKEGVPWPHKKSSLYRTVLPQHLRAIKKPRAITGTVVVEASKWVEDNQWLLGIAKDDPFIVGVVGNLKPGTEGFKKHLIRFAANPLYRGIRISQNLIRKQQQGSTTWRKDISLLIEKDLSLDVNGGSTMAMTVAELAKKNPELRIVINHISNVTIDGQQPPADWAKGMRAAAKNKNVFCKVSALVEGAMRSDAVKKKGKAPNDLQFYKPTLDVVWDAFGDDRLIYGSNWPVCERAESYATLQQLVIDYVTPKGKETLQKFFAGNAKRVYKWIDRKNRL